MKLGARGDRQPHFSTFIISHAISFTLSVGLRENILETIKHYRLEGLTHIRHHSETFKIFSMVSRSSKKRAAFKLLISTGDSVTHQEIFGKKV